jgi:hypothetical protein
VPFSEIYTEETWLNKIHQCLEARKSNLCNFVDIKKGYIIDFEQKRKVLIDSRKVGVHGDKRSGLRYNLCLIHERVERLAVDLNKLLIVKNILTIFINTLKNEG